MIITEITAQKRNDKFFNIIIDGDFAFSLSQIDILYYKLEVGSKISKERYEFILNNSILSKAKDKAFHFIGYKARTEKEIRLKLSQEFNNEVVENVVSLLKRYNYINDSEFTVKYINDRVNISNYGKRRIKMELSNKGIASDIIAEAFSSFEFDEETVITKLIEKKLKNSTAIDFKKKQKLFNFLVNRGFDFEEIKKVLDTYEVS